MGEGESLDFLLHDGHGVLVLGDLAIDVLVLSEPAVNLLVLALELLDCKLVGGVLPTCLDFVFLVDGILHLAYSALICFRLLGFLLEVQVELLYLPVDGLQSQLKLVAAVLRVLGEPGLVLNDLLLHF